MAILALRYHGPSWAQLAANLAHLGFILGPTSPQLRQKSPPNRVRNLKKRSHTSQRPPRGSPNGSRITPWDPISMVSGSILEIVLKFFLQSLLLFLMASFLKFGTVAALRAQRIGYIRRPPEGWSGVCESRCPACPISNYKLYLMVPGGPPRALKWPRQPASRASVVQFFDLSWPS